MLDLPFKDFAEPFLNDSGYFLLRSKTCRFLLLHEFLKLLVGI